jgi:hypothetical protein
MTHRPRIEAYITDRIRQGRFEEEETIVLRAHDLRRSEGRREEDTGAACALLPVPLPLTDCSSFPVTSKKTKEE